MAKLLYFTDSQIRGKSPENRIDDFYSSIVLKFKEVFKIAKKEKCDYIICGGDLFDSPIISLSIVDELIEIINKSKIPFYTVVGNHDMINTNWSQEDATTISHLMRLGTINHLDTIYEPGKYFIKGIDYRFDIEEQICKGLLDNRELKETEYNIVAVHALITDKPSPFIHCNYKEIKTNYDLVLVSHNHLDWGIQKHGKTTYVAIGALVRLTADKRDYDRIPKVCIIDTETRKIKVIELEAAKPKEEIFDITKLETDKASKNKLELFVANLKETRIQSLSLKGVIAEICQQKNINVEVKTDILKRITESEVSNG